MLKKISLLVILFISCTAQASSPFKNSDLLKRIYNFDSQYKDGIQKPLKVAVLDKGFYGYKKEIGKSLPDKTIYIPGPVEAPKDMKVDHGLRMAQILTDLATDGNRRDSAISELRLYNVYGFTNFKAAIQDLIRRKVDLVLYSEVWEFGNNFDGKGFINAEVQKATKAGIIWVNATGNFGQTTFNSDIRSGKDNWLELPDQNSSVALRCEENKSGKCPVKIVLSWNDFHNKEEVGTDKDLDLALTDDLLNIVEASRLKQTKAQEVRPGESKYPREIVAAELKPGLYFIRVKKNSHNFTQKDQLRITVDGENISMPSAQAGESLLNPADAPGVISVGAWDTARTGVSQKLNKPDIWALSSIILNDDTEFRGSSNSAAIVAAALTLKKSQNPRMNRDQLLESLSFVNHWSARGLSLSLLGFRPTERRCFKVVFPHKMPDHIQLMMAMGALLVETSHGLRLMTPYDPITLDSRLRRNMHNDLVLMTPQGLRVQPRMSRTGPEDIEVFQQPQEVGPCHLPQKTVRVFNF